MPYIPGYSHDIFISYAVKDNNGPYRSKRGWVQCFEEQLKHEVERNVTQRGPVDLWLDRNRLSCGDFFDESIRKAVRSSAVLVVLISHQYLASEWCRSEREEFVGSAGGAANTEGRIFVVGLTDLKGIKDELPAPLGRVQRIDFCEEQRGFPRLLGHPIPDENKPEHQGFYDRAYELGIAIARRLDEFAAEAVPLAKDAASPAAPCDPRRTIYLAPTPRGTDEERFSAELKTKLENAIPPVRVLPVRPIPKIQAEASEFLLGCLKESRLYLQVVGYSTGTVVKDFSAPLPRFQYEISEEAGIERIIWRAGDIEPSEIEDDWHRSMVERSLKGDVERCRQVVMDRLSVPSRPIRSREPVPSETLFVNHLPDDDELARIVCETLKRNFICVKRSFDGANEEELRRDFEENVRRSDSLWMIYGRATKAAVRAQLLECLKLVGPSEPDSKSTRAWNVVVGPPPKPSASLDLYWEGLNEIDCREDLEKPLARAVETYAKGGSRA